MISLRTYASTFKNCFKISDFACVGVKTLLCWVQENTQELFRLRLNRPDLKAMPIRHLIGRYIILYLRTCVFVYVLLSFVRFAFVLYKLENADFSVSWRNLLLKRSSCWDWARLRFIDLWSLKGSEVKTRKTRIDVYV